MGWWFGRKSAIPDAWPYVPSWLRGEAAGEVGFARSYQAQYDEVFRHNPVGQRAVRLVSGMLGSLAIVETSARSRWFLPPGCWRTSPRTCCCMAMPMCS